MNSKEILMFQKGAWVILSSIGGEIDRIFVPFGDEEDTGRLITIAIQEKLSSYSWTLDVGDTITIEEGEREV